jgi:hypothetical protein
MGKGLAAALLVGGAALMVKSMPEIRRYLKIESM